MIEKRRLTTVSLIVRERKGCGLFSAPPFQLSRVHLFPLMSRLFFYLWTSINAKSDRLARFIVKTILYSILFFRNKTTFHNGTDDERAIVRYVRNEISLRLRADHMRLPDKMFNETWIHPNISKLSGKKLEILF